MSSLDLKDGYWQIPMNVGNKKACSVETDAVSTGIGPSYRNRYDAFAYQDDTIVIGRSAAHSQLEGGFPETTGSKPENKCR